jgi:uncharacterized membrane protein YphA (DoxX/SURF4 family)
VRYRAALQHMLRWREKRWSGNGCPSLRCWVAVIGTICHPDGTRFARAVLRHLRGNKSFVAGGTKTIYETLVKANVLFPDQMACFVSSVEFVGGSLLTVGFLSSPACVALLIDMIGAVLTNTLSTMPKDFRRLTGSMISSILRKSCTCSSLSG